MRKSLPIVVVLSLFSYQASLAQTQEVVPCHADEVLEEHIARHPEIAQRQADSEQSILEWHNQANKRASSACDVRVIPTVVHVIHTNGTENISDAKINKMLDQCNSVWLKENFEMDDLDEIWHDVTANMQVELRLAKIDPKGNATNGIVRVESSATLNARDNVKSISPGWDKDKYLNIWVVRTIQNNSGSGIVLGFAYFPFMETRTTSGIVVRSDVMDRFPTTLAHELGHYLNLYHPFQGSCGTSDCLTSGDRVCDTPPRLRSNQDCPKTLNSCSNDSPDQRDMVENIMDYTSCRVMFSLGQKERVDYTFENDRSELIDIDNLFKTGVLDSNSTFGDIAADFSSDVTEICEGGKVEFYDRSCTDINNTQYTWLFPSGSPSVSFDRNPTVTYKNGGLFDVTLIISNSNGKDTIRRTSYVRSISNTSQTKAPIYEDFESRDPFPYDDWTITDNFNGVRWEITDEAASAGKYSLKLANNSFNNSGKAFIVNLPPVDLTTSNATVFNFDVAYARKSASSDVEELKVYVKNGCDGFDLLRLSERASRFASVNGYETQDFVPAGATEWKTYSVDLSAFKESSSLRVQVRFNAAGGNNFYLDNISLGDWPATTPEMSYSQF